MFLHLLFNECMLTVTGKPVSKCIINQLSERTFSAVEQEPFCPTQNPIAPCHGSLPSECRGWPDPHQNHVPVQSISTAALFPCNRAVE